MSSWAGRQKQHTPWTRPLASKNSSFHERGVAGILLAPLKWCFIGTLLLSGLMIAAWIIDWVFVFMVWPEGLSRLQSILAQDLARAHRLPSWCDDLPSFAVRTANLLHSLLFGATGIQDMGTRFADGTALSIPDSIARETYVAHHDTIQLAMMGTQAEWLQLESTDGAQPHNRGRREDGDKGVLDLAEHGGRGHHHRQQAERESAYVRVSAGTEFYIFPRATIDVRNARRASTS